MRKNNAIAINSGHCKVCRKFGFGRREPLRPAEDQAARGDARAGRHDDVLHPGDLVDRRAADLAYGLGDAVLAVESLLAELASVRVDRQMPVQLDAAVREVLRLTASA